MKWLAVAMMLVNAGFSQTKPLTQDVPSKQPTIYIGMELQLGMSRDGVITRLAATYRVVKVQGEEGDTWIVEEKNDPITIIGALGFTAGKLTYASRSWTQGNEDTYAFAQALWGAMAQIDKEDQHACSFSVPTSRSPTAEMSYVRLYCGPKRIDIETTNVFNGTGKGHYASIGEVLSSEKYR
ncbi:MAG TPA: hypothetical protein VN948_22120 [Terriglobales bacterium]|nr:hypothetical protein [Terriglobales bacterium]